MIGVLLTLAAQVPAPAPAPNAPTAQTKPADATKRGAPVKIVCDVAEPRIVTKAAAVADAAWKETCALFGTDPKPAGGPREIQLHATIAEYEAVCDKLLGGKFKRNLAVTTEKSPSVHVVLQPTIRGDAQKALAPTWATLILVAHETTHLARYCTLANYRDHPGWLKDGAATWIEAKVVAAQGAFKSPEQWPIYAQAEVGVQRLLKDAHLPSVEDLLRDRTDALDFESRYDVRWLFFRYLIEGERSKAFRAFLLGLNQIGGGPGFTADAEAQLKTRLGVTDWKVVDAGFRKWIANLKPEWFQFFVSLEPIGDDWTQTSFDETNAIAYRTAPAGDKPYAIEGSVTTYDDRSERSQANLLIGHLTLSNGKSRFVSFAFVPGFGVTVFEYDGSLAEDQQWKQKAFIDSRGSEPGKPLAFRVDCEPKEGATDVKLTLAGKVVAQFTVARPLDGPWGVGAQAGSSCVWRGVKLVAAGSK